MTKNFIDFDDYSYEVLQKIIDSAIVLKTEYRSGVTNNSLKNNTMRVLSITHL